MLAEAKAIEEEAARLSEAAAAREAEAQVAAAATAKALAAAQKDQTDQKATSMQVCVYACYWFCYFCRGPPPPLIFPIAVVCLSPLPHYSNRLYPPLFSYHGPHPSHVPNLRTN